MKLVLFLLLIICVDSFGQKKRTGDDSLLNIIKYHHKLIFSEVDTVVQVITYGLHADSNIINTKVKLQFDKGGNLLIAEQRLNDPHNFIWLYFNHGDLIIAQKINDDSGDIEQFYYPYGINTNFSGESWYTYLATAVLKITNAKRKHS